ncbi:hypothetical protein FOMPIDRAFT_128937 [Fomitopsis schrenkii]|uniref:Uncharacterized protein n=1 Tax=Fomitopsis schrenkii TaxID=2126942 RepID=S8EEB7_FOMSC|nr:hypothetical protein FOMPIDRAFT_128937 [Fomitopsis schrenkii]
MSKRLLRRLGPPTQSLQNSIQTTRRLHTSSPRHFAGAAESSLGGGKSHLIKQKLSDLRFLTRRLRPDPSRVWGTYLELLNSLRYDDMPLEDHQAVLRACTFPAHEHRVSSARRFPRQWRLEGHKHEPRFKTIIRNIRLAGFTPTIDDYHFVLEQFAAVGYFRGVGHIMEEITKLGLPKTSRTYGLCMQALCHRLSLPCDPDMRGVLVAEATQVCMRHQASMREKGIPFTSVNTDLVMRLLKETADLKSFETLLKVAYGVDLSFPDRPPLELWDQKADTDGEPSALPVLDASVQTASTTLPFSTATLTTTVDFLGRSGEISKMVQAFEVLTTPLPTSSATTSPAYDEDDEEDFGVSNPQVAPWQPPHVIPNTTTYHLLLKWLAHARKDHLVRHYVLQAIQAEKDADWALRRTIARRSRHELVAPHIAVNRSMLLAAFGLANREKNLEFMRWTLYKTGQVIRLKKRHVRLYEQRLRWWQLADRAAAEAAANASETTEAADPAPSKEALASSDSPSSAVFSSYFTLSSASEEAIEKTVHVPQTPYFDADLSAPVPSSLPHKPFNIERHLIIVRHDLEQLEGLEERIADALGRATQRVKEKLGRRVWAARDIYLRHLGRRVILGRVEWETKARFRASKTLPPRWAQVRMVKKKAYVTKAPQIPPGSIATNTGLMTSAVQPARLNS